MSKPILSELEYNADDVASAILQQADLSITNEDLGVSDKSSLFTFESGWSSTEALCFSFNGFMFVQLACQHDGSTPGTTEQFCVISDSNYHPAYDCNMTSIAYEGDSVNSINFQTNGNIRITHPLNQGGDNFFVKCNGWYRYATV
tara:strand:+ start:621 stop:1055 length:435 start_codon:yes stop_codon:yes gene_type:complete